MKAHQKKAHEYPFGPIEKLKFVACAAGIPGLSRAELAIVAVLADMADSRTGVAWPSFSTLSKRAATSSRHAKTAISTLIDKSLVEIVEHGNRIRSNRYKINLGKGDDLQSTTSNVVIPGVEGSDLGVQNVVIPGSQESINPSEQEASDGLDRSQAEGGALAASPSRASLARQPAAASDQFADFWNSIGWRATVWESEQLLRERIADGIDYQKICEGGKRWAAYNTATGGKRRASPLQWLQKEKWRDDWTLPSIRRAADKIGGKAPPKADLKSKSPTKKEKKAKKDTRNPEWVKWRANYDVYDKPFRLSKDTLDSHTQACSICKKANVRDQFCTIGDAQISVFRRALDEKLEWNQQNPAPEPYLKGGPH